MTRTLALLIALLAAPLGARAERYALIVGMNQGAQGEVPLRYAERDAERIAQILGRLGGFSQERLILLTHPEAPEVRAALEELGARAKGTGGLLFVYYSGHADGEALHLGDTRLPLTELRDAVKRARTSAKVLVLDACQSGALTRAKGPGQPKAPQDRSKGGWHGPAFTVEAEAEAEGLAILASSAAGEDAQESDALGASFFTHYLASAMLGAGDRDGDGAVSLGEAFTYASARTLAATNTTSAGPQHPTYKLELSGRRDLILTNIRSHDGVGLMSFEEPGRYLVEDLAQGTTCAEVNLRVGARKLALAAGEYRVTRRAPKHLRQGDFQIRQGQTTRVQGERMSMIEYAQVVRKGGTELGAVFSVFGTGGLRGSVQRSGPAWQTAIGLRYELPQISLEARLGVSGAKGAGDRVGPDAQPLNNTTTELSLALAAVYAFDLDWLTLALGLELGGVRVEQRFDEPMEPNRTSYGLFGGPLGLVDIPLGRFYLRIDLAAPTYYLRTGTDAQSASRGAFVTFRAGLGLGVHF